jgi:DNA adenine methylase
MQFSLIDIPKKARDAKPFLKWAGGKTQLLEELRKRVPASFGRYFEPFIGGGALFFSLQPEYACISDINPELINVYEVVRDVPEDLLQHLQQHQNTAEYFYTIRAIDRRLDYKDYSAVERASRFIYLNKTCYNGLYRVNSRGQFNAPFGAYTNPQLADADALLACNKALKNVEIVCTSFLSVEKRAKAGDFVYFDPPYLPISKTAVFTKYYKDDFQNDMQSALAQLCQRLHDKGVLFALSNSHTSSAVDLYKDFHVHIVQANRMINCKGESRGKVNEIIVTNY